MHGMLPAALALTLSTSVPPGCAPPQQFTLGRVDLVALASAYPPRERDPADGREPAAPATLRDLHARVESFLKVDVKREVEGARWRLAFAEQKAANGPTGSWDNNWAGALVAVAVGMISYSTDTRLRDAKTCLSFLEGYERRVRALNEDLPETDEAVTPDLLDRWKRLAAELRGNAPCRRTR